MDQTNIPPLVRQYSLKAHEDTPDDTLTHAIVSVIRKEDEATATGEQEAADWKKWIEFGSGSKDTALGPLENQRREVVELWTRFRRHGHLNEGRSLQTLDSVPTIATLYATIEQAQSTWHAKQAKGFRVVRNKFLNFAETMNDYSYLFSIVPSGDMYISLITGVVSSVVEVSVHYMKMVATFSNALSDMSDHLRSVEKTVPNADTPEMRKLVVDLYVGVFELLCHTLSWFMSWRKRTTATLKIDDAVPQLLKRIENTALRIDREKMHVMAGRVLDLHEKLLVRDVNRLRPVGNQSRRDDTEMIFGKLDVIERRLGYLSARTLGSVEQHQAHNLLAHSGTVQETGPPEEEQDSKTDETETSEDEKVSDEEADEECSRYDVEQWSGRLAQYLDDGRRQILNALRGNPSSLLPAETLIDVQRWIRAHESRTICVEGTSATSYGGGLSRAAIRIRDISIDAGIPCVSFFCKQPHGFAYEKDPRPKENGLVALLYSVIRQLACLLPTAFPPVEGLDESHFGLLDGSIESVPAALELIRLLLIHAPPALIWVIDGLGLAEGETTIPHLRCFLDILRDEETKRVSKVCFTTDEKSSVLMRAMNRHERVDASRMAQARPGSFLRGGSDVSELRGPAAGPF